MNHKGARGWLCASLLMASLFLTVGGDIRLLIAAPPDTDEPTVTTSESTQQTVSSLYTATSNLIITVTSMVTTTSSATSTVVSTLISKLTTTQISETTGSMILDLPDTWIVLILVVGLAFSIGLLLLFRSRYRGQLDRERMLVAQLKDKEHGKKPSETASSALKRLLELGLVQPREYIEKRMLAERLEKRTSIEKLFEEGLISKEQYDAQIQKEQD